MNFNKPIDLKLLSDGLTIPMVDVKNMLFALLTMGFLKSTFTPCCSKCDVEISIHHIAAYSAENLVLETKPVCLGCGLWITDKSKFFVKMNFWGTGTDVGEVL